MREIQYRITVEDTEAKAKVERFDQAVASTAKDTSTAATAVQNYDKATAAMAKTQTQATAAVAEFGDVTKMTTAQLDAMIAGQAGATTALSATTVATESATVASGSYGSVLFAQTEATAAASAATQTLSTRIMGAVSTIALWGTAAALATQALVDWINASAKAGVTAETAAAKQDVINKAISEGADKHIQYAAAIKYVNEQEAHRLALMPEVAYRNYHKALDDAATAAKRLADEQDALIKGSLAHGELTKQNTDIQEKWAEAVKGTTKATRDAAKAHEEFVKQLQREPFVGPTLEQLKDGNKELKDLADVQARIAVIERQGFGPTQAFADALHRVGVEADYGKEHIKELADMATFVGPKLEDAKDDADGLAGSLHKLWQGLSGGKGIGGVFTNIGKGIIDEVGAMITGGISSLIEKGIGLVASGFKRLFGGPSANELEGRKTVEDFESQFNGVTDLINQVGEAYIENGKSAADAQAAIQRMWDAEREGAEATKRAIEEINEELRHHKEVTDAIHDQGFKSQDEIMHEADIANQAYEEMLRSGKYTEDQINQAYRHYMELLAQIEGAAGDAARAWLKEHKSAEDAKDASKDALKSAEHDLKALIDKRDSLAEGIAKEAPEEVMGVIETQQRAELATLDAEIQRKAEAYAKLADETGQKMADAIKDALERLHIKIDIGYNLPSIPTIPGGGVPPGGFNPGDVHEMASGGAGYASGPTWFYTKGNEEFAFSGEGKRFSAGSDELLAEVRALRMEMSAQRVTSVQIEGREVVRASHTIYDKNQAGSLTELRELIGAT